MNLPKPKKMTADEFLVWAMMQPGGRYELEDGEVVAMAPERAGHAIVKLAVAESFGRAIVEAGLVCEVFPDGMGVRIDDTTLYEPDALVRCGDPIDRDTVEVPDPVIVVEVLSPSTRSLDGGGKLEDYFRVPSVRHYLIVRINKRSVIHHARDGDGIRTTILSGGPLRLDPPGLEVNLDAFFARL